MAGQRQNSQFFLSSSGIVDAGYTDGHMLDTTIQNKVLQYRLTARFLACSCYLDLNHALLVLYLLMDEDDTRPLLIDQPEGNLDNSSVYKQLVPYIRKAKKRRQIILITHNPNLVVATDAEQIIIASAERPSSQPFPCIRYDSGGLEHSVSGDNLGVREAVCLLLEGGEDAFRAREKRYSLVQL